MNANSLMKRIAAALALSGAFAASGTASPAGGGPYEMRAEVIGSGGGVSSGGPYVMMDTIGQPSVETFSGGQYTFVAGFWSADSTAVIPLELSAIVIR